MTEYYDGTQTINAKELPNPLVQVNIPPQLISQTEWCASPAGLTDGVDGAVMCSFADSTLQAREDCYDAAHPPPLRLKLPRT